MDAYVFQAALWCEDCTGGIKAERQSAAYRGTRFLPSNPEDESSYDSDDYPKGPYPDGGGEADSPQHCDGCGTFLRNPLTGDGETYVREALAAGDGNPDVLAEWREFYDYLTEESE